MQRSFASKNTKGDGKKKVSKKEKEEPKEEPVVDDKE